MYSKPFPTHLVPSHCLYPFGADISVLLDSIDALDSTRLPRLKGKRAASRGGGEKSLKGKTKPCHQGHGRKRGRFLGTFWCPLPPYSRPLESEDDGVHRQPQKAHHRTLDHIEGLRWCQGCRSNNSQGLLANSSQGLLVNNSQGSLGNSSQGSLANSSQGLLVKSSQGSLGNSSQGSLANSSQGLMVIAARVRWPSAVSVH